jgi:UTP--glucose-1-phosphate uridylyltransferase
MKSVKTAVIPASGYGTRQLPITKAIDKHMLPIGNRPVVDYVVADCAAAGIEHIIFIVREGSNQLQTYYGHNEALEKFLIGRGQSKNLELINNTGHGLKITYISHMPSYDRYGTAAPLEIAAESLAGEEAFAMLMGDDFVYREEGGSELKDAVEAYQNSNAEHLMLGAEIPREQASNYGVLKVNEQNSLIDLLEKPPLDQVPSPSLINISKFIFSSKILKHLEEYMALRLDPGEEYRLTDVVLNSIKAGERVEVRPIKGRYLDAGDTDAWLTANNVVANRK